MTAEERSALVRRLNVNFALLKVPTVALRGGKIQIQRWQEGKTAGYLAALKTITTFK